MAGNAPPDASVAAALGGPSSLRIGVLLNADLGDVGSFLAGATAFEAAGADSLWLSDRATGDTGDAVDPWALVAALATVTHRVRLGALADIGPPWPPALLASVIGTVDRLTRGRLIVGVHDGDASSTPALETARSAWSGPLLVRASTAAGRQLAARSAQGLIHPASAPDDAAAAFADLGTTREVPGFELWCEVTPPQGRTDWAAALVRSAAAGATGLIVPQSARLLDILRNPDHEDDRADLLLSQG